MENTADVVLRITEVKILETFINTSIEILIDQKRKFAKGKTLQLTKKSGNDEIFQSTLNWVIEN